MASHVSWLIVACLGNLNECEEIGKGNCNCNLTALLNPFVILSSLSLADFLAVFST